MNWKPRFLPNVRDAYVIDVLMGKPSTETYCDGRTFKVFLRRGHVITGTDIGKLKQGHLLVREMIRQKGFVIRIDVYSNAKGQPCVAVERVDRHRVRAYSNVSITSLNNLVDVVGGKAKILFH